MTSYFEHVFDHLVHFVDGLDIEFDGLDILFGASFFDQCHLVFELHHSQRRLELVGDTDKELLLVLDEGLDTVDEHIDGLSKGLELSGEVFEFDGFEHIFVHRGELFGQIGDIACQIVGEDRRIENDEQEGQDVGEDDDPVELGHESLQRGDILGDFQKGALLEVVGVVKDHIGAVIFGIFIGDEGDVVDIWRFFLNFDGDVECLFQKGAVDLLARMVVFGCGLDIFGLFEQLLFDLLIE